MTPTGPGMWGLDPAEVERLFAAHYPQGGDLSDEAMGPADSTTSPADHLAGSDTAIPSSGDGL